MTRFAGASVLLGMAVMAGCGVGGDDPGGMTPPGGVTPPVVSNNEVCTASFKLTGSFTPGTPGPPIDPDTNLPQTGCWPVGTWSFTAAVDSTVAQDKPCQTAPSTIGTYSFKVTRVPVDPTDTDPNADTMQQVDSTTTMPAGMQYHLSISSNGQGCQGHFEVGSADGKDYWNMGPTLLKGADGTTTAAASLGGDGDYIEYAGNGWPWAM